MGSQIASIIGEKQIENQSVIGKLGVVDGTNPGTFEIRNPKRSAPISPQPEDNGNILYQKRMNRLRKLISEKLRFRSPRLSERPLEKPDLTIVAEKKTTNNKRKEKQKKERS